MLRRLLVSLLVFSLALSFWTVPAAAEADTFHLSFEGQSAAAEFSSVDPTGCITTFVYVLAVDRKVKEIGKPEPEMTSEVFFSRYNSCTDEVLFSASGSATLAEGDFVIDKNLSEAALNTTIEVFDFVSITSFPVEVSVTWTGVGETTSTKEHLQIKEPGFKLNARFKGTFRQAEASGTVIGLGMNFTPEPAYSADMGDVKIGEVTIVQEL